MDTLDLRGLTISAYWEEANCLKPGTDANEWTAPEVKGRNANQRAADRANAQALCAGCPAAVRCLLAGALTGDTATIISGKYGTDLKNAYAALAAGVDPVSLIGGDRT